MRGTSTVNRRFAQTAPQKPQATTPPAEQLPSRYTFEVRPDGKVLVRDVPIFSENVRNFMGEELTYDEAWLRGALAADAAKGEGYWAPLHFRHNEDGRDRERAGGMKLRSVRRALYDGKPTWTLFGDLLFDTADDFERARTKFPYRSVEISTIDRPNEINSLALLTSEAPFMRYPNLTFKARGRIALGAKGALRYTMDENAKKALLAAASQVNADADSDAPSSGDDTSTSAADDSAPAGGDSDDTSKSDADSDSADADADDDVSFRKYMKKCMTAIMAALVKKSDADSDVDADADTGIDGVDMDADGGDSADFDTADSGSPGAHADDDSSRKSPKKTVSPVTNASARKASATAKSAARLEGEMAVLRGELAALRRERENEQSFSTFRTRLLPYAAKLGPKWEANLRAHVEKGTAAAFVSGVTAGAPPARRPNERPAETLESKEVAAYAAMGAEKHAAARELALLYHAAPKNSVIRKHGLAKFLASQPELRDDVEAGA